MSAEKKGLLRNKWLYIVILTVVALGAIFGGGMWFAGRDARSVSAVTDSYVNVYAGSDSTKDVADLAPLYASDAVLHDVGADRTYQGSSDIESALDSLLATPGFDLTIDYTLIGDEAAVLGWTANGTKVSTSRLAQVSGVTVLEVSKGEIMRETWYYDPVKAPF